MDKLTVMGCLEELMQDGWQQWYSDSEVQEIAKAAFELLKEQEAVEPRHIDGKHNHFIKCGNCNCDLLTGYMFCPRCGKEIRWYD